MYKLLENTALIINYYAGDVELARRSLFEFVDEVDDDLDLLLEYYERSSFDNQKVFILVHKLKPSFFYMGLEKLYDETCVFLDLIKNNHEKERIYISYKSLVQNILEEIRHLKDYADEIRIHN